MTQDELIVEIGRLIVADGKATAQPWDRYALIAYYDGSVSKLNGFGYMGDGRGRPATPETFDLEDRLDELREATRVEGKAPWLVCVFRLNRQTGKATVDFEYEHPERWHVTPATASEIAERARPA
ncbi:hypothetical protein M2650_12880 [Luteimonas sp. SX5]|uniref:DUF600 family protein n=1 Tax=Luteimonas galliterrae TaxID=2940486 RepID=A0ABT0MKU9_9GAMM|nr:hypothetical protein [Luteimonas galliterrae]MCL1635517.1 hypothetical protein [Luteimonas galliterrae]